MKSKVVLRFQLLQFLQQSQNAHVAKSIIPIFGLVTDMLDTRYSQCLASISQKFNWAELPNDFLFKLKINHVWMFAKYQPGVKPRSLLRLLVLKVTHRLKHLSWLIFIVKCLHWLDKKWKKKMKKTLKINLKLYLNILYVIPFFCSYTYSLVATFVTSSVSENEA